jgi:hypothetical protein
MWTFSLKDQCRGKPMRPPRSPPLIKTIQMAEYSNLKPAMGLFGRQEFYRNFTRISSISHKKHRNKNFFLAIQTGHT